jgi:hypothetical protein
MNAAHAPADHHEATSTPTCNRSPESLPDIYSEYSEILGILGRCPYGKAFVHSIKYRIFTIVLQDLSTKSLDFNSDDVVEWMDEQPRTWRNTKARLAHAEDDLATLRGCLTLNPQQEADFLILKFLFQCPLTLTFIHDLLSSRAEWENAEAMRKGLKLASTALEKIHQSTRLL